MFTMFCKLDGMRIISPRKPRHLLDSKCTKYHTMYMTSRLVQGRCAKVGITSKTFCSIDGGALAM